jgi:hypothetical protein
MAEKRCFEALISDIPVFLRSAIDTCDVRAMIGIAMAIGGFCLAYISLYL